MKLNINKGWGVVLALAVALVIINVPSNALQAVFDSEDLDDLEYTLCESQGCCGENTYYFTEQKVFGLVNNPFLQKGISCCAGLHAEKITIKSDDNILHKIGGVFKNIWEVDVGGLFSDLLGNKKVVTARGNLCEEVPDASLCPKLTFFDSVGLQSMTCKSRTYAALGLFIIIGILLVGYLSRALG